MNTMTDPYIRAMFGSHAIQVPFNCIVQPAGDNTILAVIAIRGPEAARLAFGSTLPHQLIMGDAVIRPHVVVESSHLVGMGIDGIARSGFTELDSWVRNGRVICDPTGRFLQAHV